jgi:hypothetical protein
VPSAAEKLLAKMRQTKQGWGQNHLHTLYLGFGFTCREGAKHRVYIHSKYKDIRDTVSRQGSLPTGYITDAIKKVDEVLRREADNEETPEGGKA